MKTKAKLIIGISLILGVIGTLVVTSMGKAATLNMTVDEFDEAKVAASVKPVKVSGKLVGDSVEWDPENILLTFELRGEEEGSKTVSVRYEGVKPDTLNDGWEAIVEGNLNEDGVFVATDLLVKCPSKYEAMEEEGQVAPENMTEEEM